MLNSCPESSLWGELSEMSAIIPVRVRFAPSPTGSLHVGGARTALFNWLFAKHRGGRFILRIEDTDEVRSTEQSTREILDGLRWLGLDWDEGPQKGGEFGPYTQMERVSIYQEYAEKLLGEGMAYHCYCAVDELAERRKKALEDGKPPGYDGRCSNLSAKDVQTFENEGRKPVLRFRVPGDGVTGFSDIIRGKVEFKNAVLDDFVILKSNQTPAFNFANVIDDFLMQITHVIRGDEHLSNTPRQVLLYGALGFDLPQFAHLPMILGPDGSKLSKRHGAVSVEWFRKEGFLADAFVNYFALLGWGTAESQQVFDSREEMIGKFSLERVSKNPAIFDIRKLEWMNGCYIRKLGIDELVELAIPCLRESNLVKGEGSAERELVRQVLKLEQERLKKLNQITGFADFFFLEDIKYDSQAVDEILKKEGVQELLESFRKTLEGAEPFDIQTVEKVTREFISNRDLKAKALMQPVRVAITGKKASPGLFEVMELLGKEKVLKRFSGTVSMLEKG